MKCGHVLYLGLFLICLATCDDISASSTQSATTSTPTTPSTATTAATSSPTPAPTTAAHITTSTPPPPLPPTTTTQSTSTTTATTTVTTTTSPSTSKVTSSTNPSQSTSKTPPETKTASTQTASTAQQTTLSSEQTTSSSGNQQPPTAVPLANNRQTTTTSVPSKHLVSNIWGREPRFWFGYKTLAQKISLAEDFPRIYKLPFLVYYFQTLVREIHIHVNGYISFGYSQEYKIVPGPSEWPSSPKLFGVYWADFDTSDNQTGLYTVEDRSFLENATVESSLIRYAWRNINAEDKYFFQPLYALAVTWENVMPNPTRHPNQHDSATFQLIFATDSDRTYIIRNYQKVWRPTDNDGFPYLVSSAYNEGRGLHYDDDILYSNPQPRIKKITKEGSSLLNNPESCVIGTQNFSSLLGSIQSLPACPCSKAQAENDELFQSYKSNWTQDCYSSVTANKEHLVQNCCYDKHGLLITDFQNAEVPLQTSLQGIWQSCCLPRSINPSFICLWFFEKTEISNCSNYIFPYVAAGFGDPHIITFDNAKYTFNSQGDFLLFKSGKGDVELQGRTQITENSNTTFFQAYVLKLGQTNYQFYLDSDKFFFNGTEQGSGVATVSSNDYTFTIASDHQSTMYEQ